VDRLYQLLATGFYNNNALFRVQKNFVVQFGICDLMDVNFFWDRRPVYDEPVAGSNLKGTISYARDGMTSRAAQLFVNMKDNFSSTRSTSMASAGFLPWQRSFPVLR